MTSSPTRTSLQERVDAYWTERAPAYDDHQRLSARSADDLVAWRAIWADALPPGPLDVLDVGTGSGYVACLLADAGHRVVGLDSSPGMIARAREHATAMVSPPDFRLGDAVAPDLPPASVDAVVSRYVLWTLRDAGTALRAWTALLRPGGVVAMVDATWFPDGLAEADGETFRATYDEEAARRMPLAAADAEQKAAMLQEAGLVDVRTTPLDSIWDLDLTHGVAPGHRPTRQVMLTARRPG